ncbi:ESX-1 secretion-associated protein [Cellulomonas sp. APG4]|uniref:type VII secretion target n=1 Tax=Cellulomonas sp. APG4 TaxID=1538656 RepID=UPI001379D491|nr:type VII secretion target [Cellulomonas sp. APG4]NCT91845.1 ESX-1 secretion-associated protein [Cellulomonas sp. APG4]
MRELAVDVDVLRQHAGRVQVVADTVARASAAARQVDLHDVAFGLLCSFLPAAFSGCETSADDAVRRTREAVEATADGVRGMARDYEVIDGDVGARLGALGRVLE